MGTVSGELSRRRTCPTKLEYPVAYLVLICCKRGPRRRSPASVRLIAFLRCALPARGFALGSRGSAALRAYLAMRASR